MRDDSFFMEVSVGLNAVIANAQSLWTDANVLWTQQRFHGYRVLMAFAEEEAAKYLILLDAVRCPRDPPALLSQQLGRFYDHLAKGLYAEASGWRIANFGELLRYIEAERRERYLDGPNLTNWILPNQILRAREDTIYVDYVEEDDGSAQWATPRYGNDLLLKYSDPATPAPLNIALALHELGFSSPGALKVIASQWRTRAIEESTHWRQLREWNYATAEELEENGLLLATPEGSYAINRAVDEWPFPLHSVDLKKVAVPEAALREIQSRWPA